MKIQDLLKQAKILLEICGYEECKNCGGNVIDIIEKQLSIITPIGQKVFVARCPNCMSESSRYIEEEDAKTKGVAEVFE